MNKEKTISTFLSISAGFLITFFLYKTSYNINFQKSNFKRSFKDDVFTLIKCTSRNKDIVAFAGFYKDNIYYESLNRGQYLKSSTDLTNFEELNFPKITNWAEESRISIHIDSPYLNIWKFVSNEMYSMNLDSNNIEDSVHSVFGFIRPCFISKSSFAIAGVDNIPNPSGILQKVVKNLFPLDQPKHSLLYNDLFGDDGVLSYDKKNNSLVMCYYFKNDIVVWDTNFNFIKSFPMLGPRNIPAVKSGFISDRLYTNTTPKYRSNKFSIVEDGYIYVLSIVKSENDSTPINKGIIDIYNLKSNKYIASLKLPSFNNEGVISFALYKNNLFALRKDSILTYAFTNF